MLNLEKHILLSFVFFICVSAEAQWSTQIQGNGNATISTNTAYIKGADGVGGNLINGISTTSALVQNITFNWTYFTTDYDAYFDPFFYSINGSRTYILNSGNSGSGSFSILLNTGDVFFLGIDNTDGCCGFSEVTISNLSLTQNNVLWGITKNGKKTSDNSIQINRNGKIGSSTIINEFGKIFNY
jgi:hypothetical protein